MSFEPRDLHTDMAEKTGDLAVRAEQDHAVHDAPDAPVKIIIAGLLGIVALWGGAVALFGLPGLFIPAVLAVPFLFGMLILISKG